MKRISFLIFLLFPLLTMHAEDSTSNKYVISWCINGKIVSTSTIPIGQPLGELPKLADDAICEGKSFYGWTAEADYSHEIDAPSCIDDNTIPLSNTTYHAVFAEKVEKNAWVKTTIKELSSDDIIIITMNIQNSKDSSTYNQLKYHAKADSLQNIVGLKVENNVVISSVDVKNFGWHIDGNEDGFTVRKAGISNTRYLYCTPSKKNCL